MKRLSPFPTVTKHTDTDTDTETEKVRTTSFGSGRQAAVTKTNWGQEQRTILAAIGVAVRNGHLPPLDRGLRSIVAQQARNLLVGGWSLSEVRDVAVDLALSWDEMRGHNRLTHLQSRVRLIDAELELARHAERMRIERNEIASPHPNLHDYKHDSKDSCSVCGGPIGVHVRKSMPA